MKLDDEPIDYNNISNCDIKALLAYVAELEKENANLRDLMGEAMRDFHGKRVLFSSRFMGEATQSENRTMRHLREIEPYYYALLSETAKSAYEDLRAQVAEIKAELSDDFSKSKCWTRGDPADRIRWLKLMLVNYRDEVNRLEAQEIND